MAGNCLLYYITDRTAFGADEPTRRKRLLEKISEAARAGIDYIQLREKDLSTRDLECLARAAVDILTKLRTEKRKLRTRLLINSRTDVALAAGADGVHLRSDDISPQDVRAIWKESSVGTPARISPEQPLVAISCHSPEEIQQADRAGVTFAVFAPVFEKKDAPGTTAKGLSLLEQACNFDVPVLALGGVTLANAQACFEAGAAGIAGIRLFQENDASGVANRLRQLRK
jgi:thiamine-phosphate pyrophosphorylase